MAFCFRRILLSLGAIFSTLDILTNPIGLSGWPSSFFLNSMTGSFTPTSKVTWKVGAFLLCMFLHLPTLPRGPHGTKGTSPKFITRPVYSRSQLRNNTNTVAVQVLLMHLFHTLQTWYAGITHHWEFQISGRGWAGSKAVHGMECSGGALTLPEVSLSRGCCLNCTVLPVQGGVLTHTTEC